MRHLPCLLLFLFCLKPGYSANANDTYPKNLNIDIVHYSFELKLNDGSDEIQAKASIAVKLKKENIPTLRFDLVNTNAELKGKGMSVLSVSMDDQLLTFTHQSNELLISIPPSNVKKEFTIEIAYKGIPNTGLAIKNNKYGDRTFFSDNWPNLGRNWLPLVDHPYDKATCEFKIIAPVKYQVVSNGIKLEESMLPSGLKLTHWKETVPIAPWLFVLGVAEFAVQYVNEFEGKSIQTWVYKQDRDAGFYDFAIPTKDVLNFYSEYVGPFAYEKLANIQSNNSSGGMESASAIMYSENSVTGERTKRWRNVVIHEIAHQWFGDAVTESDWDDVWLSEGFATYFTLVFIESAYGHDEFIEGLQASRKQVIEFQAKNWPYRIVHQNLSDMTKVTSGQTYQKGSWTLHMLRSMMGEENFKKGIQSYYRKYFNRNATTDDFKLEMEIASGVKLDQFFSQWLYQGGTPTLKGTWHFDLKNRELTIELRQTQKDFAFEIPVEVGMYKSGPLISDVQKIMLKNQPLKMTFSMESRPDKVVLDPNTKLLAEWEFIEKP